MRPVLGALAALVLGLVAPAAQAAEPSGDAAAGMYRPDTVDVVYLTLPPASITALNADPDEYVEGTFSLAETDGTPTGVGAPSTPITVEIRLKGQLGSARSLAQKAAFKIKFPKKGPFQGLRKMTLNNMVQDASSIHEALTYRAFRAAGVDASRTGYAYVYVNGTDYGLHLNLENVDDIAVEKRIGDFEHVYEGAYGVDVQTAPGPTPAEVSTTAEAFEIDEGDEDDLGDLEALIASVNSAAGGDWSRRVEALADLKQMTRMWAVEKYAGHWDGYSGIASGAYQPNNYYLQSDAEGWFRLLPWGVDQTWQDHLGFDGDAGVLFDRCLADDSCAAMYRRSLREAGEAIDAAELDDLAVDLAALVQPWVTKEQANSRHEYSLAQFQNEVQGTRNFLASRSGELAAWLGTQPAEVPASQISLSLTPTTIAADGVATTTATATVADADDDPVPGDDLVFGSSDPGQQLGPVVDNDDGTYSVVIRSSSNPGEVTITATDASTDPDLAATAALTQTVAPAAQVVVALDPAVVPADGVTFTTATATVTDAGGHPVSGDDVDFSSDDPGHRLTAVTALAGGRYSVRIAASATAGTSTVTAVARSTGVAGTAILTQTARVFPPGIGTGAGSTAGAESTTAPTTEPRPLPTVRFLARPGAFTRDRRPTFRFAADDGSSRLQCKLDDQPYRSCASPLTLPRLSRGAHTLKVRALIATGRPGPGTSCAFTIRPRHLRAH